MRFFVLLLFIAALTRPVYSAELSLLFIKSPGIDWTSPRTLAKSTVNSMSEHFGLGHVNIRVSCSDREIYTGIYNRWSDETKNAVLKKGMGLGVLFNLFEGMVQIPKNIVPNFEKMTKDNRTNFVTFKINEETCQRLLAYHDEYFELMKMRQGFTRLQRQKPDQHQQIYYGFPALPRYGEGAGCSGFALSYLEVAGIKENWMVTEWTQEYRVPVSVVGQPMRPVEVSFTSMLFDSPKRWATETEPNFPLFFWDPDRMFKDTNEKMKSGRFQLATMYGSKGYILDRTSVPTPTEPVFLNDPFKNPTTPTSIYSDVKELLRRYEISKKPSFSSEAPISSNL